MQERCHAIVTQGQVELLPKMFLVLKLLILFFFSFHCKDFDLKERKMLILFYCLKKFNLKHRVIMYRYNSRNVCKSRFKKY